MVWAHVCPNFILMSHYEYIFTNCICDFRVGALVCSMFLNNFCTAAKSDKFEGIGIIMFNNYIFWACLKANYSSWWLVLCSKCYWILKILSSPRLWGNIILYSNNCIDIIVNYQQTLKCLIELWQQCHVTCDVSNNCHNNTYILKNT